MGQERDQTKEFRGGRGEDLPHLETEAAERDLQRTRQSLRLAMRGGRMGWWTRDLRSEDVTWSPELEELFGLQPGAFSGDESTFLRYVHPDDVSLIAEAVQHSITTGEDYSVEFRFRREDGSEGWMEGRGRPTFDDEGHPDCLYGIGIDVTERHVANEQLSESEQRLRLALGAAGAGVWHIDTNTGIGTMSEECYRLYGAESASSMASFEQWIERIVPEDRAEIQEQHRQIVASGGPFRLEFRIEHPERGHRWLVSIGDTLKTHPGVLTGITYDITDVKSRGAVLEQLVKERTAELEAAYREQEAYNYSVSHDLRSPLRGIIYNCRVLEEDFGAELPEEARGILRRQSAAASRLAELIDDLLTFSRVARQSLERQSIDISDLFRAVANELRDRNPKARVEVQGGMKAKGDPRLLRSVAQNLLENALKYSPNGGTIRVSKVGDEFVVADEGIGFDMTYVDKLFIPFSRLHSQHEYQGTGIGLATVKRIIERHGGDVSARGRLGEGAEFRFSLG